MLGPGRLIEYIAVLEEIDIQLKFIRDIHEAKSLNIKYIKNYIQKLFDQKCLSIEAEKGIYYKKLMLKENKTEIENILKFCLNMDIESNEIKEFCKKYRKFEIKDIHDIARNILGRDDFETMLRRKFLIKNFYQTKLRNNNNNKKASQTTILKKRSSLSIVQSSSSIYKPKENENFVFERTQRLFKQSFGLDNKPSFLLLEEEFLYKASEFQTLSIDDKFYFDVTLIIELLNYFKNEIVENMSYCKFFNNIILLRMQATFLKELINELNKHSMHEYDLKQQIKNVYESKMEIINNLDFIIKKKRFEKAKAMVENMNRYKYFEKWKSLELVKAKTINNIRIEKVATEKESVLINQQIEETVFPLMIHAFIRENEKLRELEKQWESKIETSIENIERKLQEKSFESKKIHLKLLELRKLFQDRTAFVNSYIMEKRRNREREIKIIKITNSAKVITNWWIAKNNLAKKTKRKKKKKVPIKIK